MLVRSMGGPISTMTTETLLDWLTRLKDERRISWRELARQAKIGLGTIDHLRKHPDAIPKLKTLRCLAEWSGYSLSEVQRRAGIEVSTEAPSRDALITEMLELQASNPQLRPLFEDMRYATEEELMMLRDYLAYIRRRQQDRDSSSL